MKSRVDTKKGLSAKYTFETKHLSALVLKNDFISIKHELPVFLSYSLWSSEQRSIVFDVFNSKTFSHFENSHKRFLQMFPPGPVLFILQ